MAGTSGSGKGGNKGKPVKYSTKPATLSMSMPFKHAKPVQPESFYGHTVIRLKEKYRR